MYRSKGQQKQGEQGIALVSTLLIAMALVTALVGITSVVVMNANRTTTDESLVLAAQYAAEAGLTQAQTRILEFSELLNESVMNNDMTISGMEDYAQQYCGTYNLETVPPVGQWNDHQVANGFPLCNVDDIALASFDIFEDTIDSGVFEDMNIMSNASANQVTGYWNEILSGDISFNQMVDPNRSVDLSFGFEPIAVRVLADGGRRFVFKQKETKAIGSVFGPNGEVLASRTIALQSSQDEYYVDYGKPSFAYYNLFEEDRNTAWFVAEQSYGGPVHLNGITDTASARFLTDCSNNGGDKGTIFYGPYTAVKSSPIFSGNNTCGGDVNDATMYRSDFKYGAEYIELPENTNNQKRAVAGADHTDSADFSDENMRQAFRVSDAAWVSDSEANQQSAIYYSAGNDQDTANVSGDWLGGILVQGSVRDLKLEVNDDDRQVIEIILDSDDTNNNGGEWVREYTEEQQWQCSRRGRNCGWRTVTVSNWVWVEAGPTATSIEKVRFEQDTYSDTWTVTEFEANHNTPVRTHTMNEGFNGLIYVNGNIGRRCDDYGEKDCSMSTEDGDMAQLHANNSSDHRNFGLGGNGDNEADLASNTKLTITSTGDIVVRRNITYTDDPGAMGLVAKNVLGLYSNGGHIKVDAPWGENIELHATIMASEEDKGFGVIDYKTRRGSSRPSINILGGVIHHTYQWVGLTSGNKGYINQWSADPRFELGYAPPFFPTQQQWTSRVSSGLFNHGATWSYGN